MGFRSPARWLLQEGDCAGVWVAPASRGRPPGVREQTCVRETQPRLPEGEGPAWDRRPRGRGGPASRGRRGALCGGQRAARVSGWAAREGLEFDCVRPFKPAQAHGPNSSAAAAPDVTSPCVTAGVSVVQTASNNANRTHMLKQRLCPEDVSGLQNINPCLLTVSHSRQRCVVFIKGE